MIYIGMERARREGWHPAGNTAHTGRVSIELMVRQGAIPVEVTHNGDRARVSWVTHYFYPPSTEALAAWWAEAEASRRRLTIPCACGDAYYPGIAGLAEGHHCERCLHGRTQTQDCADCARDAARPDESES